MCVLESFRCLFGTIFVAVRIMATPWTWMSPALLALLSVVRVYAQQGCTAVKNAYTSKGFNHLEVPNKMIAGKL